MLPTWQYFNKLRGTDMDYLNPFDQLDMMAFAFSTGRERQWDCWNNLYGK